MGIKNKTSLTRFFLLYTIKVFLIPAAIVVAVLFGFMSAMRNGIVYPANHEAELLAEAAAVIEAADEVTAQMIPGQMEYVVLDKDLKTVKDAGNMSEQHRQQALSYVNENIIPAGFDNPAFYTVEGTDFVCVIRYRIIVQFSDPQLRRWIPYPEITLFIVSGLLFVAGLLLLNKKTVRNMRGELQKLLKTTEKIAGQELDFVSETNRFQELQKVTDSLDRMRDALKVSLRRQMKMEQEKARQIGALAHDIKIPVTIIRGNTELLTMTELNSRQKDFTDDILAAAQQIEEYTAALIGVSRLGAADAVKKQSVDAKQFLMEVESGFRAYLKGQGSTSFAVENKLPAGTRMNIDTAMMYRALLNVLCNTVEHGGRVLQVCLSVTQEEETFVLYIQDDGDGFDPKAIEHGTELFYTKDESRSSTRHYGIGLDFVSQAVNLHGGSLTFGNNETGGFVEIRIRYS